MKLLVPLILCLSVLGLRADDAPRPNILFAIADDASWPHKSAYGTTWIDTPGFDRVAAEGLLFNNAFTPNAKCAPSRACVLTGRNSWQLEEAGNHMAVFPPKFISYVEALGKNGYFTGYTAKGWGPGIALDEEGNPRQLTGQPFNRLKRKPPTSAMSGNDYAGNFVDFLSRAPENGPWCFWYGSTEPHRRYEFGSSIEKNGKKPSDIDRVPAYWPDTEKVRTDMLDYAFEIEHFDDHLVRMIEELERQGQLENTLIVVTSDNGMPFPRVKGQEYAMSNHLPLAIMWAGGIKEPGRVIDDYVSFIDLAPTFLEVAGLTAESAGMQPMTGLSLTDIFNSDKSGQVNPERDHVLIGKERHDIGRPNDAGYPIRGIVKNNMLYLQNFAPDRWPAGNPETGYLNTDGGATKTEILDMRRNGVEERFWALCFGKRPEEEFFRLDRDPDCVDNLAENPEYADAMQELRAQMVESLKEQGDPRILGNGDVFENYPYTNDGTRNFYERYMSGEEMRAGWVNETDFEKEPLD